MAATSISFVLGGTLQYPPDEGAAPVTVTFGITAQGASQEGGRMTLVGAGTKVIPFGTVGSPGAKGILIEYLPQAGGVPINVTFNGGTEPVEIAPGGFLALGNPVPVAGITSLSIVYTADCQLRVQLLG